MQGAKILIAEDEVIARENLQHILRKDGYTVVSVEHGAAAIRELEKSEFDLVMTDLRMQPVDGLEVLKRAKELYINVEVIVVTGFATVGSAVEAMQQGAYYYVPKPYKIDEVRIIVRQALEKKSLKQEVRELRERVKCRRDTPLIIGKSPKMEILKKTVEQIAPADCNVLILGETGTGKELVAKTIHSRSLRPTDGFSRSTAGHSAKNCFPTSFSAMKRKPSPAHEASKRDLSKPHTAARCFSTKSATCLCPCRSSCSG